MKEIPEVLTLYHTGFLELRSPDVHYGRKNADFGQGFYTTAEQDFAVRWAKEKKGSETIVNQYELNTAGLKIRQFERNAEWYFYIYSNRQRMPDLYPEDDLIIGPIANDTIFDTMGIITSGLLSEEESLKLLLIGPAYTQVVLKSQRAASQLTFQSSRVIEPQELKQYAALVAEEEAQFMKEFAAALGDA